MQIVKEGYPFIIIPLVLGLMLLIFRLNKMLNIIGILCVVISLFCIYFFRDPKIYVTKGDGLVLSPCNGRILEISENEEEKVIRVFLSVFDVHLQRSPVCGKVINIEHKNGKFLKAMDSEAHMLNEQNIITIENKNGQYIVKQIAGILARRCVTWVKVGDVLNVGDKIGMIKFSSQVDLHLPKNISIKVKRGDRVISGVTIFANLNNKETSYGRKF
ncbi:MAG: phosphatidylserine decarboxylase [Endomicrobium sp.]|jgi:phosphatidylserine decarboxylase|nr:phosphatidylserine decarboxylase [Endomicrobium sp.]